MSVEFRELYPFSLFNKAIKNDRLMSLLTRKNIRSKIRHWCNILITILNTFSPTPVLLFHYDRYCCYSRKLLISFQILDYILYKYIVDINQHI